MPLGPFILPCRRRLLPPLALATLLVGCQGLPTGAPPAAPRDPMADAPPVTQGLDAEGLTSLLVAELAGQRGDYRRAALGYLEAAERYGSTELIERAALAARFGDDPALLEETARRWQALAPRDASPARLLASLAVQRGDWTEALSQRLAALRQGGESELTDFVEMALDAGTAPAPLLRLMRDYLRDNGDTPAQRHDAELATALLEVADGQPAAAKARLDRLARQAPELPALWRIRAQLALEADAPRQALRAARQGLEVAPDDPRFLLLMAQAEIRLDRIPAAEATTNALLEAHGDTPELRLALTRLYLEEGYPAPARRLLLPMAGEDTPPPLVFFLLGAIAEEEGEVDNALLYYRQVPEGEQFLSARLSAARMLIAADRLSDARTFLRTERQRHPAYASELVSIEVELLDQVGRRTEANALLAAALARSPGDTRLRYQRAMRAHQAGDLAAMEADLRAIIERDPDNANALNALGYTLADENLEGRLAEARSLIERAHALEPNNPAILDSLGWVHYRLGDPEAALPWLEQAWAAMPDQEVAAHLIEVLWVLDQKARARALLKEARQRFEEHPRIDELLNRRPEIAD